MTCTHTEADTRMFVHVRYAVLCGHTSIMLRTVDTDVVILVISIVQDLNIQLWIGFDEGDKYLILAIHDIVQSLGMDKCKSMTFFHDFAGCEMQWIMSLQ